MPPLGVGGWGVGEEGVGEAQKLNRIQAKA
jgi:hypothetical protein